MPATKAERGWMPGTGTKAGPLPTPLHPDAYVLLERAGTMKEGIRVLKAFARAWSELERFALSVRGEPEGEYGLQFPENTCLAFEPRRLIAKLPMDESARKAIYRVYFDPYTDRQQYGIGEEADAQKLDRSVMGRRMYAGWKAMVLKITNGRITE